MSVKTLNKDWNIQHSQYNKYDLQLKAKDQNQVQGLESLKNGIIIKCLTGYEELYKTQNPIYSSFGNKAYKCLKSNQSELTLFQIRQYFTQAITEMRRVKKLNELTVTPIQHGYQVYFNVTSITDEIISDTIQL